MESSPFRKNLLMNLTILFAVFTGLYLLIGGIWLIRLGGVWYYLISGIILLVVAALLKKRQQSALLLYAALLLCSMIWALTEVGPDFWALAPRSGVLVFLGIWLMLPFIAKKLDNPKRFSFYSLGVVILISGGIMAYAAFNDPQEISGSLPTAETGPAINDVVPDSEWVAYGRTQEGQRYSPLKQINSNNVQHLKQAWVFRTGDMKRPTDPGELTNEETPLKIGDTLYFCTPHQILFALDAATGKKKWVFDPQLVTDPSFQHVTCRGVSYHAFRDDDDRVQDKSCLKRIYLPVNDGHLYAVNAETGKLCQEFADNGVLNLQDRQPIKKAGMYEPTSPPIVTENTVVIAGAVTDNFSVREPSGVIRGFDIVNGDLKWAFDPGADEPNKIPGEGEHYTFNSPNSWAPSSYDKKLDMVYLPMGVSTPDIWGGHRTPAQERYASSIVALNATTGKLVWSYQTVHHDLWDMDLPSQPTLADITDQAGHVIPAIYAPAKTGNIFVLDRRNGTLIVPAPETPVPQGAAEGDHVSPTQPFSELSFRPQHKMTGADMWGATIYDQLMCRIIFHQLRYEGIFTPPSEQGTLVFPGNLGMFEWGGISIDQKRQIAIANPMALPFVSQLIPRGPGNPMEQPKDAKGSGTESGIQPQYGVPFGVKLNAFLSPLGLPCKQPAWGYLTGVDLRTHKIIWKKRLGTVRDSAPVPLPFRMGVPMLGGPISTGGNLSFIAATADNYLRAFNTTNGELLWEARLPAGGQATPMTYEVNGKQYVVISAGGHGSFLTKMGDYIIAYALPDK